MPRIHELPTHLHVEDVLLAGLTARQLLRLMIGASLAYGLWDQSQGLPVPVRAGLAIVCAAFGVLLALFQPAGRPLDQWLLAALLFAVLPRRFVWRPGEATPRQSPPPTSGWADLAPRPDWIGTDLSTNPDDADASAAGLVAWRQTP